MHIYTLDSTCQWSQRFHLFLDLSRIKKCTYIVLLAGTFHHLQRSCGVLQSSTVYGCCPLVSRQVFEHPQQQGLHPSIFKWCVKPQEFNLLVGWFQASHLKNMRKSSKILSSKSPGETKKYFRNHQIDPSKIEWDLTNGPCSVSC